MSNENRSLDVLGIKGVSDAVRIATERTFDAASAFLSRVCLPAAEELGLALRDRVALWRARNAGQTLSRANELAAQKAVQGEINPRLVYLAYEESSWTDDNVIQEMWAGLLVSSISQERQSDENLVFMDILARLSSLQVRILKYAVETAAKFAAGQLPFARTLEIPIQELPTLFAVADLQRLDREIDHLRSLSLIGGPFGSGGIDVVEGLTNLTPTSLALHLYVRAQGATTSPAEFWNLTSLDHLPDDE